LAGFTGTNHAALLAYTQPYLCRCSFVDKLVRYAVIYALIHECRLAVTVTRPSTVSLY
jgi:hypothetical protein